MPQSKDRKENIKMIAKEEKYILIMKYDYHYNVQLAKQDESDDVTSKD